VVYKNIIIGICLCVIPIFAMDQGRDLDGKLEQESKNELSLDQKIQKFKIELEKIKANRHSIIHFSGKDINVSYASDQGTTKRSQFYIGSISKQITAFMLLTVLKKKYPNENLENLLTKKLREVFLDSKLLDAIGEKWIENMTLLELLTHRSGLENYTALYGKKDLKIMRSEVGAINIFREVAYDSKKPYAYSNTNYLLLGKLIEETEGKSYGDVFEDMVKKPAAMVNSYAPTKGNFDTFKALPEYKELKQDHEILFDFSNVGGAGCIISTVDDLLKWNHYLHHDLDEELKKVMLKSYYVEDDGDAVNLGLSTSEDTNIGKCIGFQGELDSYHSFLVFFPDSKLSVVVLSNESGDYTLLMNSFASIFKK
jgi:CubicO group peptidase (beta-lactamase class C family)